MAAPRRICQRMPRGTTLILAGLTDMETGVKRIWSRLGDGRRFSGTGQFLVGGKYLEIIMVVHVLEHMAGPNAGRIVAGTTVNRTECLGSSQTYIWNFILHYL